jgi:hypothetical protein
VVEEKEDKVKRGSRPRNYQPYFKSPTLVIPAFLLLLFLCPANFWVKAADLKGGDSDYAVIEFDIEWTAQPRIAAIGSKGGKVIELAGLNQGGRPGDPMLPYSLTRVLVPPDADLTTVQAQLSLADWEELPGEYEIAAVPPAATSGKDKPMLHWGGKDISLIVDGKDSSIYGKNAYFPEERIEIASVGEFRQWKLVEVRVWRAVYNPIQKKVCVLGSAEVAVSVERTGNISKIVPSTASIEQKMLSEVVNPQDYETFYAPQGAAPSSAADYVIITTSTIQSSSTKLADFITCKELCGHTVKVVTEGTSADDTHYVSGGSCATRANNIRDWLQNHYTTDGIEHVLLIGDPHPTTFNSSRSIPMKMCRPMPSEDTPTDMFFAELSHTWDYDGDGYYGEYSGDYRTNGADKNCEVKLGRIPFYGNYTDLDSILQKTINYCTEGGSLDWREKVLIPAAISNFGPQDNEPYGSTDYYTRVFGDTWGEAIKSLAISYAMSSYTLYEKSGVYSDGSAYPLTACSAALTQNNVKSEWQNHYGFVAWWGHGSSSGAYRRVWPSESYLTDYITQHPAETSDISFFLSSDCSSLNDSYPSYVVEVSCTNAYPESSSNLAYSLLKHGAVGTFAGTRVTWYAVETWTTSLGPSYGDNASYGYYIFQRMAGEDETAAAALNWCKSHFDMGWGDASWMNMLDFNLYGDPANYLMITCGEHPPVAYDDNVIAQQGVAKTITLQASDDGLPNPPGALSYIITSRPSHGTLKDPEAGVIRSVPYTLTDNGNEVVYTACILYLGSDSFHFKANDGGGDSGIATITIDVQPPAPSVIYTTNFNGGLPSGWSIVNGYGGATWTSTNPAGRSSSAWTGTFMIVDSDYAGEQDMDEQLITHSINCSNLMGVTLKFKHYFRYWGGGINEIGDVDIRVGGGSWQNVARYQGADFEGQVELDISSIANGKSNVQIRWRYYNVEWEWYWGIDDVEILASAVPQPMPGDFEPDCDVDFYDFAVFAAAWLSQSGESAWNPDCDISVPSDAIIDEYDLSVFCDNWLAGL